MSCNCKNNDSSETSKINTNGVVFRVFFFLVAVCLLPILMLVLIPVLFNHFVLRKDVNVVKYMAAIGKVLKKKDKDDEDDEDEEELEEGEEYEEVEVSRVSVEKIR